MLRTGAIMSTPLLGAAAVTATGSADKAQAAAKETMIRPSDLPIYAPVVAEKVCAAHPMGESSTEKATGPRGTVEDGLALVRENVTHWYRVGQTQTHRLDDFYQTGKEHSRVAIDYLNEPDNTLPRAGAIALGAAAGYIWGLRHGRIRRMLYTTIGAGAMASVCHPNDAKIYANRALDEAKAIGKIGYNFAYGVKPGDEPNYPKIPTSPSELWGSATDLFSAAKDKISTVTISGDKAK